MENEIEKSKARLGKIARQLINILNELCDESADPKIAPPMLYRKKPNTSAMRFQPNKWKPTCQCK